MKIIVTGGAGFIGSNYIGYVLKNRQNVEILCIDSLTYAGDMQNMSEYFSDARFSFSKVDITDKREVERVFESFRPEAVVNFAAESHVDRSIEEPDIFIKTNVLGTQVLLDACKKYGVSRFHQVSTDEVYGDLPLDSTDSFTEESVLRPSSPYAASKAAADLVCLSYFKTFGLNVTISRCSNNLGPKQHSEKLIPKAILCANRDKDIPVYGNGANVRDWIYVLDHCAAVQAIVEKGRAGEIYNVTANAERSNLDVVSAVIAIVGGGKIKFVEDRKGHDMRYSMSAEKIKRELGWSAKTSFEEALKKTVNLLIGK